MPDPAEPGENDPGEWLLIETLPSRHLSCNEPERGTEVLLRFLEALGPAATVDAARGEARIESGWSEEAVVHWRVEEEGLHVVAVDSRGLNPQSFAAKVMGALRFHLRVADLYGAPGPFSGLLVGPIDVDGPTYLDALFQTLRERGFVDYAIEIGQDSNSFLFPFATEGPFVWRVDVWYFGNRTFMVWITNVGSPFDGASEEEVLQSAMEKVTRRPVAYGEQHIRGDGYIRSGPR